jgi:hypothetical protein
VCVCVCVCVRPCKCISMPPVSLKELDCLATFSSRTLLLSEYFLPLLFLQLQSETRKRKLLPYIACLGQGDVLNLIEMMHSINIFKCGHDCEPWRCHVCRACFCLMRYRSTACIQTTALFSFGFCVLFTCLYRI